MAEVLDPDLAFPRMWNPFRRPPSDPGPDAYGTHAVPLTYACLRSNGPILELGVGHYSTPLLHVFSEMQRRAVLSADTSRAWLSKFRDLETDLHRFVYVPAYADDWEADPHPERWDAVAGEGQFGVVLIDHRPAGRRKDDLERFRSRADFLVVHDTQEPAYGMDDVLARFRHRRDYTRFDARTTIVSDTHPIDDVIR